MSSASIVSAPSSPVVDPNTAESINSAAQAAKMRAARETLEAATLTAKESHTSATCSILCAFGFGIATAITALLAYGLNVWHFGQTGTSGWYYGTYEVCATVTDTDLNTFDILSADWNCKSWDHTSLTSVKGFDGCKTAAEVGDVFVILGATMAAAVAVSCLVHFCYSLESKRCLNLAMTSSSIGALILVLICFVTAPTNLAVECADFNNSLTEAAGSENKRGISFFLMIVSILFAVITLVFYCRILRRISKQEHNARFENDLTRRTSIVIIPDQLSPPQKVEQLPTVQATYAGARKIEKKDTCALRVRLHQVYTVETRIRCTTSGMTHDAITPVSDSSLRVESSQSLAQLGSSIGDRFELQNNTKPGQLKIQIPDDGQEDSVPMHDDPEYDRQMSMEIAAQL